MRAAELTAALRLLGSRAIVEAEMLFTLGAEILSILTFTGNLLFCGHAQDLLQTSILSRLVIGSLLNLKFFAVIGGCPVEIANYLI